MLKYFLLWVPMIFIAVLNGTARDLVYGKYVGELMARQISTFSLILFLGIYICIIIKKHSPQSSTQAILLGLFWVVLTIGFEFSVGLYRGNTWTQLLNDYNIMAGLLWILIPIWISVSPYIFFKMQLHKS